MTPTPPSPDADILDLAGLDLQPKKPKTQTPESDFEKELEALFAEDLTEPEIKFPASGDDAGGDKLSLDDLVAEPAAAPATPYASAPAQDEDILDLGSFSAAPAQDEDILDLGSFVAPAAPAQGDDDVLDLGAFAAPAAAPAADGDGDGNDDVLDLGFFAADTDLDLTLPSDTPGGKDGGIDTAGLDDLISGLGVTKTPAPKPTERPHDDTDMSGLLDTLDVPPARPVAAPAPATELPDLEISLPDLSDPVPFALADQEPLALADKGAGQFLDTDMSGLLDGGMMEGLEAPADEPVVELSMDPAALLDQISDGPSAPEPERKGGLLDGMTLGDVSIGAAAAVALGAVAAHGLGGKATPAAIPLEGLQALQEKLTALATQVMGGSVAVVRLEGQLAEKDRALGAMEQHLQLSQQEAQSLRRELADLRAQLEETLRQRAQASDKAESEFKQRLTLVEDRQIQIDREVRTEIERAVPREAARVIREEIAALAASMHDD